MSTATKIVCRPASNDEMSRHFAIRHQVFVAEQGVMVFTDIDDHDRDARVVHVLGSIAAFDNSTGSMSEVDGGTVRLYPLDDRGLWQGDRLAVLPQYRASTLGMRLVRFAVATAAQAGGVAMRANVQAQNARFFERLGWVCDGDPQPYYGRPHQPMLIDFATATIR
jgi:putative N-acetyltransferase (TIGR04045 family)